MELISLRFMQKIKGKEFKMIDLPESVPVFRTQDANLAYSCAIKAGKYYDVSPYLVQTVLQIEGGVKGSKVRNSNGTYDYGPMQINTIWIKELERLENIKVKEQDLINDVCYNIHIGTWILSSRISEVNGDVWRGLGNYHSKTRKFHDRYLGHARKAYSDILSHWTKTLGVSNSSSVPKLVEAYSTSTRKKSSPDNTIGYSFSP